MVVEQPEKEPGPDKGSKQYLCSELNKVKLHNPSQCFIVEKKVLTRYLTCSPLNFFQVIDASDVVIEVLDARDPMGCRCPQLEEAVLQRGGNKKLLLVLSKIGKWT